MALATGSRSRRTVRLPRRALVEPVSVVEAPYFRSGAFSFRAGLLLVVALAVFGVLGLRLWSLQVLHGVRLERVATSQAFRTVPLPAARGAIVDDRGRVLVETGGRLVVTADPRALGKTADTGVWQPSRHGQRLIRKLALLAHTSAAVLLQRIQRSVRSDPVAPAVVVPDASLALASFLAERARSYPGLATGALPERWYPLGAFGGEFLGLLGQLDTVEIALREYPWAHAGELVGQSGVEAAYDGLLNGGFSLARVPVDALGRPRGQLSLARPARRPESLQLTIDTRLQQVAERAIRDGIELAHQNGHLDADAGAAVVMNARTGALYALASYPALNQAAAANDPSYLERLLRGRTEHSPLIDLATQGLYPTGSAFKPIVAEAALATGLITPTTWLPCTGSLTVGGIVFHNVEAWIDTSLTLPQALEISCDTWFYRLGEGFYVRQRHRNLDMQRWAHLLGLGHPTGIDIPGESAGVVPTPAWLERSYHQSWYEGQSVNLSIGQGYLDVTPLQLAVAYSALANGGTVVRPHVVAAVLGPSGRRQLSFPPVRRLHLVDVNAIREGLYMAANDPGGTSAAVYGGFRPAVAGKTGTAQAPTGSDHSWYASWAPAWHPKVVVVTLIEHGGFGAQAAAPAAREIYQAFFHLPDGG